MKNADDRPGAPGLPGDFGGLLEQIAREPVPEKLLDLALRLQAELRRQRVTARDLVGPSA